MDIFQSIILGIIEGLTEFLPVSSTFHLIFASKILALSETEFLKTFQIIIQSGAILALSTLYLKALVTNKKLLINVVVSFIPTAVVGFVLYRVIKGVFFESTLAMLITFAGVGILFLVIEYLISQKKILLEKGVNKIGLKDALVIGALQSTSIMPGVSRAGAVIVGMMCMGYRRDEAAYYSFLLSIPTIFAAGALDFYKERELILGGNRDILPLIIGFVTAFVSAYFVVKWFIGYLKSHSLSAFGIYRLIGAGILLIVGFRLIPSLF